MSTQDEPYDFIRKVEDSAAPPLWEVDLDALFDSTTYALEHAEVEALAAWIAGVCGGSNDLADHLREVIGAA